MIDRKLLPVLKKQIGKYPVSYITGPRQSGKTTLLKAAFPEYNYLNLERPNQRRLAQEEPEAFLLQQKGPLIIDEAQYAPELFSYLQVIVDESGEKGQYILSGSQNFLPNDQISQSLAGRVGIFTLLPFSYSEMQGTEFEPENLNQLLFKGSYHRLYQDRLEPGEWIPFYIQTYLERDVRSIINLKSLSNFQRFIRVCAARTGQVVNLSQMARDVGITTPTATEWLSVLESSYLVYLLKPYYNNFTKRIKYLDKFRFAFYELHVLCLKGHYPGVDIRM
jgi:predicted AAA+ superfamily ATPase